MPVQCSFSRRNSRWSSWPRIAFGEKPRWRRQPVDQHRARQGDQRPAPGQARLVVDPKPQPQGRLLQIEDYRKGPRLAAVPVGPVGGVEGVVPVVAPRSRRSWRQVHHLAATVERGDAERADIGRLHQRLGRVGRRPASQGGRCAKRHPSAMPAVHRPIRRMPTSTHAPCAGGSVGRRGDCVNCGRPAAPRRTPAAWRCFLPPAPRPAPPRRKWPGGLVEDFRAMNDAAALGVVRAEHQPADAGVAERRSRRTWRRARA